MKSLVKREFSAQEANAFNKVLNVLTVSTCRAKFSGVEDDMFRSAAVLVIMLHVA